MLLSGRFEGVGTHFVILFCSTEEDGGGHDVFPVFVGNGFFCVFFFVLIHDVTVGFCNVFEIRACTFFYLFP